MIKPEYKLPHGWKWIKYNHPECEWGAQKGKNKIGLGNHIANIKSIVETMIDAIEQEPVWLGPRYDNRVKRPKINTPD